MITALTNFIYNIANYIVGALDGALTNFNVDLSTITFTPTLWGTPWLTLNLYETLVIFASVLVWWLTIYYIYHIFKSFFKLIFAPIKGVFR